MAGFTTVTSSRVAKALPQFSHAVKYNNTVFTSGNVGLTPDTEQMVEGGVKEQTVT